MKDRPIASILARYNLYGLVIGSAWKLPFPEAVPDAFDVQLLSGAAEVESAARQSPPPADTEWFHHDRLPDGSVYLCWIGLFDFLVAADGRTVWGRPLAGATEESFHTYLLGHVLSFVLLLRGDEILHATAVVVDGATVAFLGDSGYGKSTLGTSFARAGYPILTDDLLVVRKTESGWLTYPGPQRVKLLPDMAGSLLDEQLDSSPMNNRGAKLVMRVADAHWHIAPAPLRAIYCLTPPKAVRGSRVTLRRLVGRSAFLHLLRNTFNRSLLDLTRPARQMAWAAALTNSVPIKLISYPRQLEWLPRVIEAVVADSTGKRGRAGATTEE